MKKNPYEQGCLLEKIPGWKRRRVCNSEDDDMFCRTPDKNNDDDFQHLDGETRNSILTILHETKDGLPAYWNPASETTSQIPPSPQ